MEKKQNYSDLLNPKLIPIFFLGFTSGFPYALIASTLVIWLTESGVSITSIGLFTFTALPYSLKFLWSPFIDGINLPILHKLLGKRRSWLFLIQSLLIISIILLGYSDPKEHILLCATIASIISYLSASQDVVIDAFRIEKLEEDLQGLGATMISFGYRIGLYASGAGLLILATYVSWSTAYVFAAIAMSVGLMTTLICDEPHKERGHEKKSPSLAIFLGKIIINPFKDFMLYEKWYLIILFVILYKLGDAMAGIMTNPFLVNLGFTKPEIVTVVKTYGLFATLAGSLLGGIIVYRMHIIKALLICGIFQMLSNLMFVAQFHAGHDTLFLILTISLENAASGMGGVAMIAYLSKLCNLNFAATQYALLSSVASVSRNVLSGVSGFIIASQGWSNFFLITTFAAIPGILLIFVIKNLSKKQVV